MPLNAFTLASLSVLLPRRKILPQYRQNAKKKSLSNIQLL